MERQIGQAYQIHRSKPSVAELQTKTAWIRDTLEPDVARNGSDHLHPDTILELAAFFQLLLDHSGPTTLSAPSITRPIFQRITFSDIQASRIHKALLLIVGRGTRWPMKLIEACESIVEIWTERFGKLSTLRPLLYEKGGRLHLVKEEKDMGRHALLVKWLSDRNTLVSPLKALEWGHIEFEPGQWWIHPIFAFHDGIIDSPDPQGGITADSDGAYAIMLTGDDEMESKSPESFIYRVRKDDKGKHRLLQTLMRPRRPVRVLRSHALQSLWSPIAGLRYEGLFWVSGYVVKTDAKKEVCFQVSMERDDEQVWMSSVQKHPTAAEVDDYVEYKRLRYLRLQRAWDQSKSASKADQILGVIQPLRDPGPEFEIERDVEDLRRGRRGAIRPDEMDDLSKDQIDQILYPESSNPSPGPSHKRVARFLPPLDGVDVQACANPIAHAFPSPYPKDTKVPSTDTSEPCEPAAPIRDCCADERSHSQSKLSENELDQDIASETTVEQCVYELSANFKDDNNKLCISHSDLRKLKTNIGILTKATRSRGVVSKKFHEDLVGVVQMVEELERDMMERRGCVDQCVWDLGKQLTDLALESVVADPNNGKSEILHKGGESPVGEDSS